MPAPTRGLHESLITEELERQLRELGEELEVMRSEVSSAEIADRIALHVGRVLLWAVNSVSEAKRTQLGIELARTLIEHIDGAIPKAGAATEAPVLSGEWLQAVLGRMPDGRPELIVAPLIPLLDTTLLTNSPGEPRVGKQVLTEIESADRIDVVMAFIRRSGMRPMVAALRKHCSAGKPLRVLTTTYTGSTEAAALEDLIELGANVRVSYDTSVTRLHAKAWMFHRDSGFSTGYIGSSNLTHSAQISGLEWNVRVSGARNPDVLEKVEAVFESYWNSGDFVPYDREDFIERTRVERPTGPTIILSPTELRPEPFQERLLEQIALAREQGHHRNLLVSATGTGKTVMAALDYARLKEALPRARLLFVAHRKEILDQSQGTFRYALRDPAFGEQWVGGQRPRAFEHVFASIQSLNAAGIADLAPDHFDVVIVDEFHHAAAMSYRQLLEHLKPRELLGLTATPERSDGLSVLEYFDGRIAAELRLWDAIDQHRLTPFLYYGIHDDVDLTEVPWKRGRGYDVDGLTKVLTADDARARLVLKQLIDHVDDAGSMRVLGFCVSVEHARFMARVFAAAGAKAAAIWGDSRPDERQQALSDLSAGRINVLFSVDLFNEGLDLPRVDTLLMLRPTDSPTLFLQQLGRGLRKTKGKSACTVLDFVGHHRKEFRFDRRFRALLGGSRKHLTEQVEQGFPYLPAGCHMELDAVASDIVLKNIKAAVPSLWSAKAAELQQIAADTAEGDVGLPTFLDESGLDLDDVYSGRHGWSSLRQDAGLPIEASGPHEVALRKAVSRMLHIDDALRLNRFREWLAREQPVDPTALSEVDRRLLRMLAASTVNAVVTKDTSLEDGLALLWKHPQVRADLLALLDVLASRQDHIQATLHDHPDVPLRVHARYTRREIQAGLGDGSHLKPPEWREGVRWLPDSKTDVFAFTLDKTSGHFSPTTRYRDYAVNREFIHWESQSGTRAESKTGQRYQHHDKEHSHVMLCVRLNTSDKAYWFLGPAHYIDHKGERPMAVRWKLEHPLPGDLFAAFAAAVA